VAAMHATLSPATPSRRCASTPAARARAAAGGGERVCICIYCGRWPGVVPNAAVGARTSTDQNNGLDARSGAFTVLHISAQSPFSWLAMVSALGALASSSATHALNTARPRPQPQSSASEQHFALRQAKVGTPRGGSNVPLLAASVSDGP